MRRAYIQHQPRHLAGWRPDRPDPRDMRLGIHWPWQPRATPIPDVVDLRPNWPRIEDQGEIGSCTAHAATSAMEYLYRRAGLEQPELSRLFLYYASRVWVEGALPSEDSGAMLRDVMTALAQLGTCLEPTWDYDLSRWKEKPSDKAIAEARRHRITTYLRCETISDIEGSLAEGYPVVIGFSVPESMMTDAVALSGDVPMPRGGERFIGGHAIVLCGHDRHALDAGAFDFAGSWGRKWGRDGFGRLPYGYVTQRLAADAWTIRSEEM